jgi:DNA polymerase III subunit delta'
MLFNEVIGHKALKERFINAVKENRVSHALLITGTEGAGGLPLALAFAQYLTCEQPGIDDSCGKCPSCVKNQKMVHPDVHYSYPVVKEANKEAKSSVYIEEFRTIVLQRPYLDLSDWFEFLGVENKQGYISVEESADILRKLQLKSFESVYKVIILWMPEKLRTDSANKLLKILEEPPDNTVFFLVTENGDQLLPTILSRLQILKASRLTDEEIIGALVKNKEISEAEARSIAHMADGNYHLALSLASGDLPEKSAEELFIDWMRLCFNPMKTLPKLYQWIDVFSKSGRENQKQFLLSCMQIMRECIMVNVGPQEMVRLDDTQYDKLKLFFPFIKESNVHYIIKDLNEAIFHIERNANPKILFLDLSFRLSHLLKKA